MEDFLPLQRIDGYLPIEHHGLIGDGTTAALVGRDGSIPWLCIPRFDSSALFCGILDSERGGAFTISPEGITGSRQYYVPDSGVLVTEMKSPSGTVRVTDALTLRAGADLSEDAPAGRGELVRQVEVLRGKVRLNAGIVSRGGAETRMTGNGLLLKSLDHRFPDVHLYSTLPLRGLKTTLQLKAGEQGHLVLRWGTQARRYHQVSPDEAVRETVHSWQRWLRNFTYEGPEERLVRRSALTLKLLDYTPTGAMVAAPTSSLPEAIGGPRNWDYRYAWVRDAAFSVYTFRRIGLTREAESFLGWVLDSVEREGRPRVMYDLDGNRPPLEQEDPVLTGYRGSAPVRWGNAAAGQAQHDVYGEILDCAYQWARGGGQIDERLWSVLRTLVDAARTNWHKPDHGIWEVRTSGRPFTYSAALCHVALDRGARLAERFGLPGDVQGWKNEAELIRRAVLEEAWDPVSDSLTEHLGGGGLDASLLALPLRRVIPADHPKMVATTRAIADRLGAGNGLLYRYVPEESPDGLPGHEGAFLLCSFWLVENLSRQGRLDEAMDLFSSLCGRANDLGLLPEEIDPTSGAFLGNYPQAFSHVGLISSGFNLARTAREAKK